LEKRDYRIRHAAEEDLAVLRNLEERCWAKDLQTPGDVLVKRLSDYPEGQFVLELEGRVAGVIYSQRIASEEALQGTNSETISSLHRADGPLIQLLAVNIDPEVQERQLGDRLLEFMLQRCSVMPGISAVVGVTLCRDYHKQKEMPMEEYIHKRDDHRRLSDPVLRFHERHGAMVTELVARYRLRDRNNEGFGVVVRYDIHNRRRREVKVNTKQVLPEKAFSEEAVEEFLEGMIKKLLGRDKEESFSKERPLMEMGLDSAALLKLSE
ncbi:MAG: GNAT family N-acetyltransferase, partial [Deltaproteobacteria bacterium]|nr:GNAT family N-acetyltransferase [Deltaproteobacteria bacterium]